MFSYYYKNGLNRLSYQKQYYQENENKIKEYTHDYNEKNKETLKNKRTQKMFVGNNNYKNETNKISNKIEKIMKNILLNFFIKKCKFIKSTKKIK
jgi:hypothetical protein